MTAADPMDVYRGGATYQRERARLAKALAEPAEPAPDLLAEWIEFGRLPWWRQMFSRKPRD